MRSFFLLFAICLSLPSWANEGARVPVTEVMEGKDLVTGRKITIPLNRGYKFSIVDAGTSRPYMKVYDANGLEVQAFFALPSLEKALSPEEKAALEEKKKANEKAREAAATNELKQEISSGLEATAKGAVVAKEGCCNVDGKKKEPEAAEVDQPAEKIVEIESPPEDFFDVSPEHAEAEEAKPAKAKPELEVVSSDPAPEAAKAPAGKPRGENRSPALQRPEPQAQVAPLPVPRPRQLELPSRLDRASGARTRKQNDEAEARRAEEEAKHPRRPASNNYLCRAYDAFKAKGVPDQPLRQALLFLDKNRDKFGGERYLSIADYSQSSTKERFYLLDLKTFAVTREKVSHGGGRRNSGDPDHDGMLNSCGGSGSERTRGGFFEVGDYYYSQKGRYQWPMLTRSPARNGMKLRGLTPGVNANVYADGYVMHEAKYNSGGEAVMGRSDGCPAFVRGRGGPILAKLRGGSLQYHFTPQCGDHHRRALSQVRGWESFCK